MKRILLSTITLFIGFISHSQVPVLFYDFEVNTSTNRSAFENAVEQAVNSGNSAFTTFGLTNFGSFNGAGSLYGGNVGQAMGANGWPRNEVDVNINADKYFQFSFNTSGFSGLSLEFDCLKSLNNAPKKLGVIWSKDGVNFFTATTIDNTTSDNKWKTSVFSLGSGADNQANIIVRIYGYDAGNASPFLYIDNVTLKATTLSGVKTLLDYTAYGTSLASGKNTNPFSQTCQSAEQVQLFT